MALDKKKYQIEYDKLLKLANSDSEKRAFLILTAKTYKEKLDYDKALELLKSAETLGNATAELNAELGFLHEKTGTFEEAVKYLIRAREQGIDNKDLRFCLALLYSRQGNYTSALKELESIAEADRSREVYLEMLSVYRKLKKANSSINICSKFMEQEWEYDKKDNEELRAYCKSISSSKKNLKIKILRTPFFDKNNNGALDYSLLLPVGIGQIVSYLTKNGVTIVQDDLNIKINHDNMFADEENRIDKELFFDEERIFSYLEHPDNSIDSVMEKVEKKTTLQGYDVILLSIPDGLNFSGYYFALAFCKHFKTKYNAKLIVGGRNAILDKFLKHDLSYIDHIARGRGEKLLFKILTALEYEIDLSKIPGLFLNNNGKLLEESRFHLDDIKPTYEGLPLELYEYRNERILKCSDPELSPLIEAINKSKVLISPYRLVDGCFHNCIFCGSSGSRIVMSKDPKKVVDELVMLRNEYNIKYFFFLDPTLNISTDYVQELCDRLIEKKLDILWADCARGDNLTKDLLLKLRKAGCIRLIYGMETASQRLLKYINKQINLERLKDVMRWTDEAGIWVGLEVINGFPHENREDIIATVDFIKKNSSSINEISYNVLWLLKESSLYKHPEKHGIANISEIDHSRHERQDIVFNINHSIDEVGGMKGKDKVKQMILDYDYLTTNTESYKYSFPNYEAEHFLFYLYSRYKEKSKILELFNKVRNSFADCRTN